MTTCGGIVAAGRLSSVSWRQVATAVNWRQPFDVSSGHRFTCVTVAMLWFLSCMPVCIFCVVKMTGNKFGETACYLNNFRGSDSGDECISFVGIIRWVYMVFSGFKFLTSVFCCFCEVESNVLFLCILRTLFHQKCSEMFNVIWSMLHCIVSQSFTLAIYFVTLRFTFWTSSLSNRIISAIYKT